MGQNHQEEKRIRRVNRELKYQGAIVDVYSDTIETPDGSIAYWDYVEHRKGAAAVVPVTPEGRILMVRQYRNALDRYTIAGRMQGFSDRGYENKCHAGIRGRNRLSVWSYRKDAFFKDDRSFL